jgi:pimeloyl-ACP methyl ester carboxylesterase
MESLSLGNRTVAFRSYGRDIDPDLPPLVLVHGAGGNHLVWPAQVRHLPHTSVYALDLPGHGASPGPGCSSISAYSEVVRDFVDILELPWFVLAGHSMGGAVALDFGLAYAHRLAGVVAIGAGARMRVSAALLDGILHDYDAATAMMVEHSYHPTTAEAEKELYRRHLRENDAHTLYGDLVACHNFDLVDRISSSTLPTLLICGQQDQMTPPERSVYLHNHIAGSELHVIEDAGHNVMIEKPAVVTALFASFMQRLAVHEDLYGV